MSDQTEDDDLWEAMADPTRRKLLDLLVVRGQATATTLTADMPVSRQAISKHLMLLQRVGLVDGHRDGREVRYELSEQRLADATRALAAVASGRSNSSPSKRTPRPFRRARSLTETRNTV